MNDLVVQVKHYCRENNLFEPGPVVVAVSGGADSLTLLHVLIALRDEFSISLHVATLDHGLRGEAGAQDVAFVREIAAKWGVPVSAGKADVRALASEAHLGIEEAARRARYDFLAEVAHNIGAKTIATGHNQNDQAETVLMHALRGSGLSGLRGILPKRPLIQDKNITLVRPLLDTSSYRIYNYMTYHVHVEPRKDGTNDDLDYFRNWMRRKVLPLLNDNPFTRVTPQPALARLAQIARDEYDALRLNLPAWNVLPSGSSETSGLSLPRETFRRLHIALQRIMLRDAIARLAPNLSIYFEQLEMLRKRLVDESWRDTIEWTWPLFVSADHEMIYLYLPALPNPLAKFPPDCPHLISGSTLTLSAPGDHAIGDGWQLHIERIDPGNVEAVDRNPLSVILAIKEGAILELRTRLPGDHFKPHGMGGHSQKVHDMLVNMKVLSVLRDLVCLLTVDGEIAWIVAPTANGPRSRMAEDFAPRPDDPRPLWQFTFVLAD